MGAVAGKIMIRPMGEYDPSTVYDILDLVKYDNKPWLCRKSNIMGVEPSEVNSDYWMLVIDISIANADTLDWHDSSYFATSEALSELANVVDSLDAEDVGARPSDWMPSAEDVGARPSDWMPSAEDVGAPTKAEVNQLKSDFTEHKGAKNPHGTTASDVGALVYTKSGSITNFTTILEAVNSMTNGGSFTVYINHPLCNAEDSPMVNVEFHYLVLRDEFGRKRVIAISFSDNNFEIFTRRIFSDAWNDAKWNRLTDVFFKQSGGTVNGNVDFNHNVTFNNGVHIVGGMDDSEGGQMMFAVPQKGNYSGNLTMDICGDQFRWFVNHAGTLKQFILDFSLFEGGNATIYTTKTIIGSDSDIIANTSPLTTNLVYQVYE